MTIRELATEITKTAIENHAIVFNNCAHSDDSETEYQNTFNAKQVADFYATIYEALKAAQ